MTYRIKWSDGSESTEYASHQDAVRAFRAEYPEGEYGHDGDLTLGGDRTLLWATELESRDDDGQLAVGQIVREDESETHPYRYP